VDEVLPGTPSSLRGNVENNSEKGFLDLCLNQRNHNEFFLGMLEFPIIWDDFLKFRNHS